jgi:hypothetical protein
VDIFSSTGFWDLSEGRVRDVALKQLMWPTTLSQLTLPPLHNPAVEQITPYLCHVSLFLTYGENLRWLNLQGTFRNAKHYVLSFSLQVNGNVLYNIRAQRVNDTGTKAQRLTLFRPLSYPSKTYIWNRYLIFMLTVEERLRVTAHGMRQHWEELIAYLIRYGPQWKRRVQQFFYCCVCFRYRGNVPTKPLPSNDNGTFTIY